MGNYLTFIDIYNKVGVAAEAGDFQTVVYQIARMMRRIIIFESMENGALVSATYKLGAYLNYFSSLGNDKDQNENSPFSELDRELSRLNLKQNSFNFS